jgi:hypothetical protein
LFPRGAAAFTGNLDFTHDRQVVEICDLSASVKEERSVPQWLGAIGIVAGFGLLAAGALRK